MVPMTAAVKQALVKIHNQKRNDIAMGNVANYDAAANMATIEWDDSLAASAALNVRFPSNMSGVLRCWSHT